METWRFLSVVRHPSATSSFACCVFLEEGRKGGRREEGGREEGGKEGGGREGRREGGSERPLK